MADYITISELASILGQNITGEEDFIVTKNNTSYKITLSELDAYLRIQEVDKLSKNENLADLENKEIARTNLDVYSKDESNNILNNAIIDYVVPLGDSTSGDYVKNILPGTGIDILNGTGEGSIPEISISDIGTAGTYTKVITNNKGQVIGNEFLIHSDIPELDASKITSGIISAERLPSFVDDVLEFQNYIDLPTFGESGKIYVVISDENMNNQTSTYRWTGSVFALVSNNLTALDIKNLYESNNNTNAFTDTLLSKLNGIQNGAQVNTVTRVSGRVGNVILTKSDVGLNNVQNIDTTNASNISSGTLNSDRLPDSGVIEGSYGSETQVPIINVDSTGRITNIENEIIFIPSGDISVTGGDITLSGTTGVEITNATLVDTGVTTGTYRSVTVDSKGRITEGTNPSTIAEYEISDAYTKTEVQETLPAVGFDITNSVPPTRIGQMKWNQTEGTIDLALENDVTLQIGQENNRKVRNDTASTITNGTLVMSTGSIGNSGRIKIAPFTGLIGQAKYIYGIVTQDIAPGTDGFVTIDGKVRGINTTGSTVGEVWEDGDVLYAKPNDDGHLTKIVPSIGELKVSVAQVVHAHTNGTLEIRISSVVDENEYEPRNSNIQTHISATNNPHNVTKKQIDLGNVDNTADVDKNVLSATKLSTARKINDVDFDGSSDIEINSRLGTSIASASTTNIGTTNTKETVHITGTETINSFGISSTGAIRNLIFDDILIIKSSINIIFPSNFDIVTETGNIFTFICEDGPNAIWRCINTIPSRLW